MRSGKMQEIIDNCIELGVESRFQISSTPSSEPHVQSENNGGFKANSQLREAMLTLHESEDLEDGVEEEEYAD